jgi:hypothetical protein
MKHIKLIKSEESYNTWKDSDEAGYPHVAMYEANHPDVTSGESIIFEKRTEKPKPINQGVIKIKQTSKSFDVIIEFDYEVTSDMFFKIYNTNNLAYSAAIFTGKKNMTLTSCVGTYSYFEYSPTEDENYTYDVELISD